MPTYEVHATNSEYLLTKRIYARNRDKAIDKYLEMWDKGLIDVNDSDMVVEAEKVKE